MFPDPTRPGGHFDQVKLGQARWLCHICPVQDECLEDALAMSAERDMVGVRAGYTAQERRELRKWRRDREAERRRDERCATIVGRDV